MCTWRSATQANGHFVARVRPRGLLYVLCVWVKHVIDTLSTFQEDDHRVGVGEISNPEERLVCPGFHFCQKGKDKIDSLSTFHFVWRSVEAVFEWRGRALKNREWVRWNRGTWSTARAKTSYNSSAHAAFGSSSEKVRGRRLKTWCVRERFWLNK